MRLRLQLVLEDIAAFEREVLTLDTLGLQLTEAKTLLATLQKTVVTLQIRDYVDKTRQCPQCGTAYVGKGTHPIAFRTLFGRLTLTSPRFYRCECQTGADGPKSFSPLARQLTERAAPEFIYLQTKWAALMSYGLTVDLLTECFPLDTPLSTAVVSDRVQTVAMRLDAELGPRAGDVY